MYRNILLILLILCCNCREKDTADRENQERIIATLEKETLYFCERDIVRWREQWSHEPYVSKMYTGNREFLEFKGWDAIERNTMEHMTRYPDTIPLPKTNMEYQITLFGETAFVFYSKEGENGNIRENRFMVKEKGKWKIARMQTIY